MRRIFSIPLVICVLAVAVYPQTTEVLSEDAEQIYDFSNVPMDRAIIAVPDKRTGDLLLRDLVTGENRNLTNNGPDKKGKEFAWSPIISDDGKLLVYWVEGGPGTEWSEIRSIHGDGTGLRTQLARKTKAESVSPLALSPDKQTVIVQGSAQTDLLSLADGSLKPFADGASIGTARFSPDGTQIVYTKQQEIFVANMDGGNAHALQLSGPQSSSRNYSPVWTPDGRWILYAGSGPGGTGIWAVPFGGGTSRLLHPLRDVTVDLLEGMTRDGSLYYSATGTQTDIRVVQPDPADGAVMSAPTRLIDTFPGHNSQPAFSPDGKWIAWLSQRTADSADASVVVRLAAGGLEKVLPIDPRISLQWFPDSQALLIRRVDNNQTVFERVEVVDGRITELYRADHVSGGSGDVVTDGNALWWLRCDTATPCDLVRYDLRTKSETVEVLGKIQGSSVGTAMRISPDGKWLAVIGKAASAPGTGLFVRPAGGGTPTELARTFGIDVAEGFAWTADSKSIVFGASGVLRTVPAAGGERKILWLPGEHPDLLEGTHPSTDPRGRLAYTETLPRAQFLVTHDLLPRE